MRRAGLSGQIKRRRGKTTIRVQGVRTASDLVERDFNPVASNRLWAADITYIRTWEGWLYLASVMDCYSRRIVGWAIADHLRAELVVDALEMAVARRRPDAGLVHHSDQGGQGGFQRSSQHSITRSCDGQAEAGVGSSRAAGDAFAGTAAGRAARASCSGSGRRSRGASAATRRVSRRACRPSWASGGFGRLAGCRRSVRLRCRGGTCRSPSARRSRCCGLVAAGCARSRAGWVASPSTISRELRRNAATRSGRFDVSRDNGAVACRSARQAPQAGEAGAQRLGCAATCRIGWPAACNVPTASRSAGPEVAWIGRRRGRRRDRRWARSWSPEQISNRLRLDFPDDDSMRISPEAIYQSLYVQGRGALKRELTACLRTGRALRVPRARACGRGKRFVTDEVMISQRPAEAADRAVPGHWEGDLILGLRQLGDRHAGRAVEPVHDAAASAADGRPGRPPRQGRPGPDRSRRSKPSATRSSPR